MTIVRKPKPGQRRLIRPPSPVARAPSTKGSKAHGWFWEEHDTSAASAGPHRWTDALTSIHAHRADGGELFSEDRMRGIAGKFETQIAAAARAHGVSELLLLAVISVESAGKAGAASPKGAQGLMQLIPATAKRFGVADSFLVSRALTLNWPTLEHAVTSSSSEESLPMMWNAVMSRVGNIVFSNVERRDVTGGQNRVFQP